MRSLWGVTRPKGRGLEQDGRGQGKDVPIGKMRWRKPASDCGDQWDDAWNSAQLAACDGCRLGVLSVLRSLLRELL